MRELSMHILDLAQNSIAAGATEVTISVEANTKADYLRIAMRDDGRGMSEEQLASVRDPFYTTRTTRRVGLGIPMLAEAARACGGDMRIASSPGKGTSWTAMFQLSHIDRAPLGDVASTLVALIAANPDIRFRYTQSVDGSEFRLDTDEIKAQLDGVPINEGAVLKWIGDYVREQANGRAAIA